MRLLAPLDCSSSVQPCKWGCGIISRVIRRLALPLLMTLPARAVARIRTEGLENLDGLNGPVIFAANHQSHLDTYVLIAAVPRRWRYRIAPAMCHSYFGGRKRWLRLRNRFK